jgi:ribonuclease Z
MEIYEISTSGVVFQGSEYEIIAVEADHDEPSWSYVFKEHPRPGKFHPERAIATGVPKGPLWKNLQIGEDIKLSDGRIVFSREVVDPPRKGRKIVYSGDTKPTEKLILASQGADILIHEATFEGLLIDKADENRHSTVTQAAEVAKNAGVNTLILTHISSRYPDALPLLEEAIKVFPNTIVAEDLLEIELP